MPLENKSLTGVFGITGTKMTPPVSRLIFETFEATKFTISFSVTIPLFRGTTYARGSSSSSALKSSFS